MFKRKSTLIRHRSQIHTKERGWLSTDTAEDSAEDVSQSVPHKERLARLEARLAMLEEAMDSELPGPSGQQDNTPQDYESPDSQEDDDNPSKWKGQTTRCICQLQHDDGM